MRPPAKGPRSLILRTTLRPFSRLATAHAARHGQGRVRRGQRVHVVDFAIGGSLAVEAGPVPRRHAGSVVVRVRAGNVSHAADDVGFADLVAIRRAGGHRGYSCKRRARGAAAAARGTRCFIARQLGRDHAVGKPAHGDGEISGAVPPEGGPEIVVDHPRRLRPPHRAARWRPAGDGSASRGRRGGGRRAPASRRWALRCRGREARHRSPPAGAPPFPMSGRPSSRRERGSWRWRRRRLPNSPRCRGVRRRRGPRHMERKLLGMNWLWPIAPAHDPSMSAGAICPSSRMRQRRQQFAAEERRPAAVPGQRREGGNDAVVAGAAPEIGLDAPQGDDEARLHAVGRGDGVEQRAVAREALPRCFDPAVGHDEVEIFPRGHAAFGLASVEFDHPRQRLDVLQGGVQQRFADSAVTASARNSASHSSKGSSAAAPDAQSATRAAAARTESGRGTAHGTSGQCRAAMRCLPYPATRHNASPAPSALPELKPEAPKRDVEARPPRRRGPDLPGPVAPPGRDHERNAPPFGV